MSGGLRHDGGAQLALLDAMVFFAISVLICSMLLSSVASNADRELRAAIDYPDPSGLLAVFLAASVGDPVPLAGTGLELTGREQFGEALLAAADLVRHGFPAAVLTPFLAHCGEVLARLSPAPYVPWLQVFSDEGVGWVMLVSTGDVDALHHDSISASQDLVARDGTRMVAVLALRPALLPHVIDV